MKRLLPFATAMMVWLALVGPAFAVSTTIDYTPSTAVFANPERGFFHAGETHSWGYTPLDPVVLQGYRQEGITLIKRYFYLDEFVPNYYNLPAWPWPGGYDFQSENPDYPIYNPLYDGSPVPISAAYLANIEADFDVLRTAGLKAVVRFAYTNKRMEPPFEDADLDQLLDHLDQLRPILQTHSDVIALVEAGFIGNWGEWFYTDHFTTDPKNNLDDITAADYAERGEVLDSLLAVLPSHMVQLRTPHYKYQIFDYDSQKPRSLPAPLDASSAHDGGDIARTGHHNDCFLGNDTDAGTFGVWLGIGDDKDYLAAETNYVAMGGEVCNPGGGGATRFDCGSTLAELEQFHWSYLNVQTGALGDEVYNGWDTGGCLPEIKQKLGYRFVLEQGTYADMVEPDGSFAIDIRLRNDGWAAPFNLRPVELVLRHVNTGYIHTVPLPGEDPRFWLAGDTRTLTHTLQAPMLSGDYELLLHLPDPHPTLSDRPEYAIRFANDGVWEAAIGYNDLGHILHVDHIELALPDLTTGYSQVLTVPVSISDASGLVSAELFVEFDTALLTLTGVNSTGTLTDGWSVESNTETGSGSLETVMLAMATDNSSVSGSATLVELVFAVADVRVPASSPLTVQHALLNNGTPGVIAADGSVTVVGVDGSIASLPEQIIPRQGIAVTVVDADADLDGAPDTATDKVTVMVTSSNGDEETLMLDEDAVVAGTFSQTIPTVFGETENDGDGFIQAQDGDLITFAYSDELAADGTGPVPRTDQTGVVGGTDGAVEFSIASQPGDLVYIQVVDADISVPPLDYVPAGTAVDVEVVNGTTTDVLTVTLSETSAGSGVFVGSLETTSGMELGKMTTAEEDTLTVTYIDDLGAAGEAPANLTDDNLVLDPWGDADDNDQLQAFDAALTLLEVLDGSTLEGLPELAANVDVDPVGTGVNPFDASLILQHRVGIIDVFPVQDAASSNHPQPNPGSPKPIPEERLLALRVYDGYVSVWMEDRSVVVSGDLMIEGISGRVEMGEERGDFLSASRTTEEGLRVVFAGAEATSGSGELLRVYGVGAVDVQLTRADLNGGSMVVRIGETERVSSVPSAFALYPNHPNPFNPETTIGYDVAEKGSVRLRVYDVAGQVVRELIDSVQPAGSYRVVWDGRDKDGAQVANGVYLYELTAGDYRAIRKMTMMK